MGQLAQVAEPGLGHPDAERRPGASEDERDRELQAAGAVLPGLGGCTGRDAGNALFEVYQLYSAKHTRADRPRWRQRLRNERETHQFDPVKDGECPGSYFP
jgi:hypothetical protein